MGWLPILLNAIAAWLMYVTGHLVLMAVAIIAAIGSFWSWGLMHNYATELARRRPGYIGGFYNITDQEAEAVPDWLACINFACGLVGLLILLIGGISIIRAQ